MHRCLVRTGRIVCNAEKSLCNGTLSVSVSVPALQVAQCCGPARRARDIDRLLHGRHSAVAAGERGQCHVVGVRRKLNADVFRFLRATFLVAYSVASWWRGTVVERRSLAGELSLSCARPAADG